MATEKTLGARLGSAIGYVRRGASVADIGTDHAYLPIFLVRAGIASRALACDIGSGPLGRAAEHIAAAGLSERISTLQTDGLHGVERFSPDHILIFGMGGELIVKILSEAPWVRRASVRLVLQPMSRAEALRRYLWENGFAIVGETLTAEDGRIYQTVCAEWRGEPEAFTPTDCLIGKPEYNAASPLYAAFLRQKIGVEREIIKGKTQSKHADAAADRAALRALEARLREIGETI